MNAPRGWHCMASIETPTITTATRLFVFGGCFLQNTTLPLIQQNLPSPFQMQTAQPVTITEYYTPHTNQWTIVKPMINLHKEASCIISVSNRNASIIYIFGGYNVETKTGQKLISQYDCEKDEWSTVGQLSHGMTGVSSCILDLPSSYNERQNELNDLDISSNLSRLNFNDSNTNDSIDEDECLEWSTQTSLPSDGDEFNKKTKKQINRRTFKCKKSSSSSISTTKTS
jgi:hypothetical protein